MEQGKDYYFDNGWLNKPPALKDEIKGLWKSEGALPEGIDPDARVEQVLYVVRRNTDQIVGLCSTSGSSVPDAVIIFTITELSSLRN